jgi:hypothetical protein
MLFVIILFGRVAKIIPIAYSWPSTIGVKFHTKGNKLEFQVINFQLFWASTCENRTSQQRKNSNIPFKTCWLLVMEEQLPQYISNKLKKMVVLGWTLKYIRKKIITKDFKFQRGLNPLK